MRLSKPILGHLKSLLDDVYSTLTERSLSEFQSDFLRVLHALNYDCHSFQWTENTPDSIAWRSLLSVERVIQILGFSPWVIHLNSEIGGVANLLVSTHVLAYFKDKRRSGGVVYRKFREYQILDLASGVQDLVEGLQKFVSLFLHSPLLNFK